MSGCCDDFVKPVGGGAGGGGGSGVTNAIQSISGGTTVATGPGVSLANGNGVSFGINGNTITASVAAGAALGISGGTQSASTGTVNFANSNGISFGLSGSSQMTASFAAIKSLSAGTVVASGPLVSFSNGSGVSFGINGNTITASVAAQTPETPFGLSAGTQSVSTGTVNFSNSNGVSFGMSGSNVVTASVAAIKTISAGTTNMVGPDVSFSNANGVSFGINGSTITASVGAVAPFTHSAFVPMADASRVQVAFEQSTLRIQARTTPNMVWSNIGMLHSFSGNAASVGTATVSRLFGIYTRNVSSLSLLMSTSFSYSINHSSAINASINQGIRMATTGWSSSLAEGDYYFANVDFSSISSDNVSISQILANAGMPAGFNGYVGVGTSPAANRSAQDAFGYGYLSVATAALPASMGLSDIWAADSAVRRPPYFELVVSI